MLIGLMLSKPDERGILTVFPVLYYDIANKSAVLHHTLP